jgi:hypothetical protein
VSPPCGLVAQVARDFLHKDERGQFGLRPGGARAVAVAVEISARLGTLAACLDELLRLCIRLERARSVEAAKMLEEAAASASGVRQLLGVRSGISLVPHLQRRRLRLLDKPRARGHLQVRDLLQAQSHRPRRLAL